MEISIWCIFLNKITKKKKSSFLIAHEQVSHWFKKQQLFCFKVMDSYLEPICRNFLIENSDFSFLFGHTEAVHTHRSGCLSFKSGWKWSCSVAASRPTQMKCWIKILQRLPIFRMGWMKTTNANPFFCTKMRVVGVWSTDPDLQFMLSSDSDHASAFVLKRHHSVMEPELRIQLNFWVCTPQIMTVQENAVFPGVLLLHIPPGLC